MSFHVLPDQGPVGVSISFDRHAVIYEDAYTNLPAVAEFRSEGLAVWDNEMAHSGWVGRCIWGNQESHKTGSNRSSLRDRARWCFDDKKVRTLREADNRWTHLA